MPFSPADLALLADAEEVRIETTRSDGSRHRTVIWVVTDGADVFVRSVRGPAGRWYQAALANPDVTIHAEGRAIAARAVLAADERSIARCSAGLRVKYAGDPSTPSMLRDHVLETTLRLEPA